jgi:PhnB protein
MQLNPMLTFNGQCEAAFKFYEQCLGGKIQTIMTWGESPMAEQVPSEWRDRIIHVSLMLGEAALLGGDAPPDRYEKPQGLAVTIQVKDAAEGERIFNELAEKGTVQMPFQKTFWSSGFGVCVDRFDIPWMVNCQHSA